VVAAPLVLLGFWLQRKREIERRSGSAAPLFASRPHGIMQPPVNPWLRDDLQPRMRSRWWGGGRGAGGAGGAAPGGAGAARPEAAAGGVT
jgi:hypothetical protein